MLRYVMSFFSRDPYSNQPYVSQLTPIQVLESIPHLECKLKVRVRKTDFYHRCSYVSRWFTKLSAKCFVVEIYHNLVGRLFWWIVFKKTQTSTDVFLPFGDFWSFLLVFVPRELENTQYSSAWYVFAPVIEWAERISYTPERFVYIYIYIHTICTYIYIRTLYIYIYTLYKDSPMIIKNI